ncbi:ABC transporter permease [Saccharopolyspora sp. CA-218241]|uniref:ABC transporter permease n=1 Tax=Saccharopolyspora sp. CA-218241 TaxID=3240027 RepID=UPI003D95139C
MSAVPALSRVELKLLVRNRAVAVSALALPLAAGAYLAFAFPGGSDVRVWSTVIGVQVLMVLGFTVYFGATASLTARREDRYLKRLRSGEQGDVAILTGLLLPLVLLSLLQSAVLVAIAVAAGAPLPARPEVLLLAVLLGSALCVAAGAVTSAWTSSSEHAQITTVPFFLLLVGGLVWSGLPAPVDPSGALVDLIRAAMTDDLAAALPAAGVLLAWTAVLAVLATRTFRWSPR